MCLLSHIYIHLQLHCTKTLTYIKNIHINTDGITHTSTQQAYNTNTHINKTLHKYSIILHCELSLEWLAGVKKRKRRPDKKEWKYGKPRYIQVHKLTDKNIFSEVFS